MRSGVARPSRMSVIRCRRSRSWRRDCSGVSVINVSHRSNAIALIIARSSSLRTQDAGLRTRSNHRNASAKSLFVAVEELQRRLGVAPAVVADAAVDIHEPESFDFDAEREDRLRPLREDALRLGGLALGEVLALRHGLAREPLHFRQELRGFLVREGLLLAQRRTSATHFSNFARSAFASSRWFERRSSS